MILGNVFHDVILYIHLYKKRVFGFWFLGEMLIFYFLFFPNKVLMVMVLHLIQNLQPFSVFTIIIYPLFFYFYFDWNNIITLSSYQLIL
jgi:hypothetical protein